MGVRCNACSLRSCNFRFTEGFGCSPGFLQSNWLKLLSPMATIYIISWFMMFLDLMMIYPYKNGLKLGAHPPIWGNATRVLVEFLSKQSSSSSTPWMHSAVAASGPAFAKRRPAGESCAIVNTRGGGHPTWGPEVRDESLAWKHNDAEDADAAEFSAGVPGGDWAQPNCLWTWEGEGITMKFDRRFQHPPIPCQSKRDFS